MQAGAWGAWLGISMRVSSGLVQAEALGTCGSSQQSLLCPSGEKASFKQSCWDRK